MDKIIKRFFINKQNTGAGVIVNRLPALSKAAMEHFGWDESTPMRMTYTATGVLIERDKEKK